MFTKPAILTHKQRSFYDLISDHIQNHGQAPTIKEMMKMCRASSPRSVQQYLEVLEKKGLISRSRYEQRGIFLTDTVPGMQGTVFLPVVASAGCDHGSIFAEKNFDEYVCIAAEALAGRKKDNVVCIRAVGNSMDDAGVNDGDNVLMEITDAVQEGDLVVAILDGFAVIKKLEIANNAIILRPVSSDPQYKPIILRRDFKIFGRVIDVIRVPQKGDIEVVPFMGNE
jgi:SOS regulatory protein LexA